MIIQVHLQLLHVSNFDVMAVTSLHLVHADSAGQATPGGKP